MAQARAFQQGLRRAVKAEEESNRIHSGSNARNRRKTHRGGKGPNENVEDYSSLGTSIARRGEIKYHAANEKKMRAKAAQDSDDDDWGWIGEADGKAAGQNDGAHEQQNGNTANPNDSGTTTTSQRDSNPDYIPPHKRPVKSKEQMREQAKDDAEEEDLTVLGDKTKEKAPAPPQHLMARLKMLDLVDGDDDHDEGGGVPIS